MLWSEIIEQNMNIEAFIYDCKLQLTSQGILTYLKLN